ncbi:MAG: MBL fold metallo-hydrolase [Rhodoferax sp.]|nr:MBL fold metallo-hydrolase [Rhodoferax sp.]
MLRFRSLGSGSSGNATLVEGSDGLRITRLLVDCGFGLKQLDARLAKAGLDADQIDAVFITHEHGDHIGCARQLALRNRKMVWMSPGTHAALDTPDFMGLLQLAQDGTSIDLGGIQIQPFTVPHDAREPLQLTCTDGSRRLGILTDLGHATAHVLEQLSLCDALLLECNHEADMLARSAYPPFLKKRVGGNFGHLSNQQASEIVRGVAHEGLQTVVAAHLSLQNNHPDLARAALCLALGCDLNDVGVADPVQGTDWITF